MNQLSMTGTFALPIPRSGAPKRFSRDEMNLAEFPLTVLSTRTDPRIKTLEFSDYVKSKNGELLERKWIITGADKFGLPTASDDEILLGLLKLTVDSGFMQRKIFFTRYELLRILRWTTEGRSYTRLQKALDRLSGVRIKASNAFYDNELKSHSTRNFGIIDAYEINDGRTHEPKPSFFIWSEVIFKSFQAGFIKKLDLEFYLELKSAVSKRLYRFLDKHFWYRSTVKFNVFTLAHEKIGISRNYRFVSSLRQQLDPGLEELRDRGFISDFFYFGKGQTAEIEIVGQRRKDNPNHGHLESRSEVSIEGGNQARSEAGAGGHSLEHKNPAQLKAAIFDTTSSEHIKHAAKREIAAQHEIKAQSMIAEAVVAEDFPEKQLHRSALSTGGEDGVSDRIGLMQALCSRGLQQAAAQRLIYSKPGEQLAKIWRILRHFDYLIASNSRLVSRSPVGFLYRAVERSENFVLPDDKRAGEGLRTSQSGNTRAGNMFASVNDAGAYSDKQHARRKQPDEDSIKAQYLIERRNTLEQMKLGTEPQLLDKIYREVEAGLSKFRGQISNERLAEAIEHGVEGRLADLFALPSYDEWLREKRRRRKID